MRLITDIQDELERGRFTFHEIARQYEVPVGWVVEIAEHMQTYFHPQDWKHSFEMVE